MAVRRSLTRVRSGASYEANAPAVEADEASAAGGRNGGEGAAVRTVGTRGVVGVCDPGTEGFALE